jgi:hypothetical protein
MLPNRDMTEIGEKGINLRYLLSPFFEYFGQSSIKLEKYGTI